MTLLPLPPDAPVRTMVGLLERVAAGGDRAVLTATSASGDVVRVGGEQLVELVARAASRLAAEGLGRAAVVGIHLDNSAGLEALVLHWAAQWMGAAAVPLGTRLTVPELAYIASDADVVLVCSAGTGLDDARALVGERPAARLLDCTPGLLALAGDRAPTPAAAVDEHDLADLLYTSGTTGRPKGVELTHANNVAAGLELVAAVGLDGDAVYQSSVPYFTSTGAHTNPLLCLAAGAHLVLEERFDQHAVLPRAAAEGTTVYMGAPSMLALLLRDVDLSTRPASVGQLVFGGSVMNEVTLGRLAGGFPGCRLTNLYGQTEAGPGGTVCKPEFALTKPGSIGNQGFGPWTSFTVLGDDGAPVPAGDLGEIALRSPAVIRGYRNLPEATAEALRGGWLHTGDIGYVDHDGFLFYADRAKDLIIRGGMNVSSAEVEAVLLTFPGIVDAAVVAVDHEILGEDVVAVVVAPDGLDRDALAVHARARLADYKTPRRVEVVDELPRNAMGKVLKRELRERLRTG